MLLQYYPINVTVPHTSTCHITSITNDNIATISSPIFASIDFTSNQFNLSSGLNVPIHSNENVEISEDGLDATLVCDDNDIFNMYVRL